MDQVNHFLSPLYGEESFRCLITQRKEEKQTMDKKSIEIDPLSNHSEVELQDWIEEQ